MWRPLSYIMWQVPLPAWLGCLVFLLILLRRLPFLFAYLIGFTMLSLVGTWLTSAWSPLSGMAQTVVSVLFAASNDWRFFILLAHYGLGLTTTSAFAASAIVSVLVTGECLALSYSISGFVPRTVEWHLVYSLSTLVLLLVIRVFWQRRSGQPQIQRWLARVFAFELWQYTGWALANIILASGSLRGDVISSVVNLACNAAFLPFVLALAPGPLVGRFAVKREKPEGLAKKIVGRSNLN